MKERVLGVGYRSCLNELYSLRDAALAAAYRLRFGKLDAFDMRKLKRVVGESADSKGATLTASAMFDPKNGTPIIDRMSLHRSVALHCLGATNPVVGDVYQLRHAVGPFGKIPYLIYPLYDDLARMREIERGASKAIFNAPDQKEAQRFLSLPSHRDALEFCFDCLTTLLRISEAFADEIGIEPEITTLTDKDILELEFTEGGVTRRFKRNPDTGTLEEL